MILGLLVAAAFAADAPTYVWPLDLPRQLSSSFAEYRTGRFHAGIDLRTGGATGQPVHAPLDGYVSRIRCSPWGYGKAVYITLADGNNVVFGHLQEFDRTLTSYVRGVQHERHAYTVDLYPEAGRFPVKAGEVVAHSGDTGIGPAHLHYELRDANQHPINPRLVGVTWPDDTTPVIRELLVAPSGPGSTVNGDLVPQVAAVRSAGAGRYVCDPVRASGTIGFGVDVIDPANNGNNALGVHELRTRVNGTTLFTVRNDRISYDNNHDGIVSFHPFFLHEGRFLLQWRWPGNQAEPFQVSDSDGWLAVPTDPATVTIEAEDFAGNIATLEIPIVPAGVDVSAPSTTAPEAGKGAVSLQCEGTWLALTAAFPNDEAETPTLEIDEDGRPVAAAFTRISASQFRAAYAPGLEAQRVALHVRHPRALPFDESLLVFQQGRGRTVEADGVRMNVADGSPYGTLVARLERVPAPKPSKLPMLGTALRVWPDEMPVNAPIELSFAAPPEATAKAEVYRLASYGWTREATEHRDGRLVVAASRFGTYAIMTDTIAPTISILSPGKDTQPARRPSIRVRVADVGSGVDEVTAYCGDQWLLMAYDPESGTASWEQDEDLPSGKHELRFTVTDGVGNSATRSTTITAP